MNNPDISIVPQAFGCEEEMGYGVSFDGEKNFRDCNEYNLQNSIPDEAVGAGQHLRNGGRFYIAGHPEICTPECTTLDEITEHIRANEELAVDIAGNYLLAGGTTEAGIDGENGIVRIQRRVVDGHNNRWGMHDNFGVTSNLQRLYTTDPNARRVFFGHIVARSFVTGAGHVTPGKVTFAQKIDGLTDIERYGNIGSMYRFNEDDGTRAEVRCGDINISDWAVRMRFGCMSLALAISQTPVPDKLVGPPSKAVIAEAKKANTLNMGQDGIVASPQLMHSIDYQQRLSEYALDKLPKYIGELTDDQWETAHDLYEYCEDMRAVVRGEDTIKLLTDRADWAAKMYVIQKKTEQANQKGADRNLCDLQAQSLDLAYDRIDVQIIDGELQPPKYGWGYKFRDKPIFLDTVPQSDVDYAYRNAPRTTRASIRQELFDTYEVKSATWSTVNIMPHVPTSSDPYVKLEFEDVTQTELTRDQKITLMRGIKKLPPEITM